MGEDNNGNNTKDVYHFLLFSLVGFGHINPILQLGKTILKVASTTDIDLKISVIINLHKDDLVKLTASQLEENDNFKVLIKEYDAADMLSALDWYSDLTEESVVDIYAGLLRTSSKTSTWPVPRLIIQDQFFYIGYVLAKHWKIPFVSFSPAPLIYNYYNKLVQNIFKAKTIEGLSVEQPPNGVLLSTPRKETDKENLDLDNTTTAAAPSEKLDLPEKADTTAGNDASDAVEEALQMLQSYNAIESIEIPGMGLITKSSLPKATNLKAMGKLFLRALKSHPYTSAVVCNDVESACHPEIMRNLREPLERPCAQTADEQQPAELKGPFDVYCIGPLCLSDSRLNCDIWRNNSGVKDWLDRQAPRSVLFVCLGSWCDLCPADLVEFARGLQLSGKKVLWGYRPIASLERMSQFLSLKSHEQRPAAEELDETSRLPVGYLDEVKDTMLIEKWVNQPAILQHEAVGCFLTHCGWNSITEGVTLGGKPMLCLPVAAEQGMNAQWICKAHGAGIRLWESRQTDQIDREKMKNAIDEIFSNPTYAQKATELHEKFKRAAEVETASSMRKLLERVKSHYQC